MKEFFAGKNTVLLTDERELPGIRAWHMELEENEFGHMTCRLEEAVTFICMLRGTMTCQVNQEKTELSSGEGIFINSHSAYRFLSSGEGGCEFYTVAVKEEYLNADEVTTQKYVNSVIKEDGISLIKFDFGENQENVPENVRSIGAVLEEKEIGYELEVRSLVFRMWKNLYKELQKASAAPKKAELREKVKLYKMLEFLHIHYNEKITLSELAENSEVSTGEYCRFFKKRMEQTPFEYLQAYRIEKSLPEILEKSDSISNIAAKHGFTGSSYFAETFKKEMGCAPGDYRKWYRGETDGECPLKPQKEEKKQASKAAKAVKAVKAAEKPVEKPVEKPAEQQEEKAAPVRRQSMATYLL